MFENAKIIDLHDHAWMRSYVDRLSSQKVEQENFTLINSDPQLVKAGVQGLVYSIFQTSSYLRSEFCPLPNCPVEPIRVVCVPLEFTRTDSEKILSIKELDDESIARIINTRIKITACSEHILELIYSSHVESVLATLQPDQSSQAEVKKFIRKKSGKMAKADQ